MWRHFKKWSFFHLILQDVGLLMVYRIQFSFVPTNEKKKKKKEFRYIGKCPNVPALTRHLQEEHHFQCFIFSGNKQSHAPQFLQKLELWAGLPTSSACDRRVKYTQLYWKQNALVHNAVVDYSSFRHCQMQDLCIWQKSFFFFPSRKQKLSWVRKNNIAAVDAIKQSTPKALIK